MTRRSFVLSLRIALADRAHHRAISIFSEPFDSALGFLPAGRPAWRRRQDIEQTDELIAWAVHIH